MDGEETPTAGRSFSRGGGDRLLGWRLLRRRSLSCALILAILILGFLAGSASAFERHEDLASPEAELEGGSSNLLWLTFMIAGMDSVNPCAFYILTFLLSILIYARDRLRIMIVGGIFVAVSGLCYFLFMAAWLNVLELLNRFKPAIWIIMIAVIAAGTLNVKDYLLGGAGPSLGASEKSLAKIGRSARRLMSIESTAGLVVGASILAFTVNLYELFCTPGFPLMYVSLLSSLNLDPVAYYLYLAFYNVVYVLPLLGIVLLFAYTLGRMRISGLWAKRIKLISGYLMIGLALAMLLRPWILAYLETTLQLLAAALAASAITMLAYEKLLGRRPA